MPVTHYTALVTQCLQKRFTQRNAHILDRVVGVDVQIPFGLNGQVQRPMAGHLIEHVLQEPYAGVHPGFATSVQIQVNRDPGFQGFPCHRTRSSAHVRFSSWQVIEG